MAKGIVFDSSLANEGFNNEPSFQYPVPIPVPTPNDTFDIQSSAKTEFVFEESRVSFDVPQGYTLTQALPDVATYFGIQNATVSFEGYKFLDLNGGELSLDSVVPINSVIRIVPTALSTQQKKYDDVVELVGDLANENLEKWSSKTTEQSTLFIELFINDRLCNSFRFFF
ncbi:hypothetical protein FACS1894125_6860 [Actinomycetota bacterium]|nr:hypothetical protein FACS1894125_6860 [Actinomycetota bacterium]